MYLYLGRFYFAQRQYANAAEHLRKSVSKRPDASGLAITNNAHLLLFQCDSALGNYYQAIQHYQRYKYYNDSMFNVAQARQISELQIQYETEKKDQSLQLQQQQIFLREKDVLLLKRQGLLQASRLRQVELEQQQNLLDAQRKDQDIELKEKTSPSLRRTRSCNRVSWKGSTHAQRLIRRRGFAAGHHRAPDQRLSPQTTA